MNEELQLFDIQCKASGQLLLTIEAADLTTALERIPLAYQTNPHLRRPAGNVLVYEHDPDALVTGPCLRDGFFQMLAARAATQH